MASSASSGATVGAAELAAPPPRKSLRARVARLCRLIGPGVITGAADDDPSGIATYSIAGAQLGTSMLWTALLTWPLMATVQLACARLGMVTGAGLGRSLRKKFPRWVLAVACVALLAANTLNIGADIAGMADAAVELFGGSYAIFVVGFAGVITAAVVLVSYRRFASVLKWLVLSVIAYVVTAFITHPRWSAVWHDLLVPHWPHGRDEWSTLVALLGTTISPYLFFWQSSQEVEEEKCLGRGRISARAGATRTELADRRIDVWFGTFVSNLVMFFVILSCAMTLHRAGATNIQTSREAAEALRPLAGGFATALYATGIVGLGLLAIPTLAGSSAYALAETFNWNQGLNLRYPGARGFYRVIIGSIGAGLVFALFRVSPVRVLFWTAVINGVLAPLALVGVLAVIRDRKLMNGQPCSKLSSATIAVTSVIMAGAAVIMFAEG